MKKHPSQLAILALLVIAPFGAAAQSSSITEYLPAGTQMYVQIPDMSDFVSGLSGSSTGRIWSDPGVQEFLAPVLPMLDMELMQATAMLRSQGLPENLLDFSQWDNFECGYAINELDIKHAMIAGSLMGGGGGGGTFMGHGKPTVRLSAAIVIAYKQEQMADQLFTFLYKAVGDDQNAQLTETDFGKTWTFTDDEGTVFAQLNGGEIMLSAIMGEAPTTKLSDNQEFLASRKANSEEVYLYLDLGETVDLMDEVLAGLPTEASQFINPVVSGLGLEALGIFNMSTGWKDGDSVLYGSATINSASKGLIASAHNTGVADLGMLDYIPNEATSFSLSSIDAEKSWSVLEYLIAACSSGVDAYIEAGGAEVSRAELEQLPFYDWVNGSKQTQLKAMVESFGPRSFTWAVADAGSLMGGGGGGGGTFIEVRNVDEVRATMTALINELEGISTPESPVSFRVKQLTLRERNEEGKWITRKGPDYYEMRINNLDLPPELASLSMLTAQFVPTWAITDDGWLVSATSSSPIRKALRDGVKVVEDSIKENQDVKDFLGRLPDTATTLAWSDPRPMIGGLVTMAQSMLPMVAGAVPPEQIPFDLNKFPGPDSFTTHLRPSEAWAINNASGTSFESVGSFSGGEAILLAGTIGIGVLVFGIRAKSPPSHLTPVPAGDEEVMFSLGDSDSAVDQQIAEYDKQLEQTVKAKADTAKLEGQTQANLVSIQGAIMVYQMELGALPGDLEQLNQPQKDWPNGFLKTFDCSLSDAWGNELIYNATADGTYLLYSCGADGVDNQLGGDDITVEQ